MQIEHRMSESHRIFLDALGRYERPLIRFALGYTGELEDARDVVQDVFVKLSQNMHTIDHNRIAPWLFTTCRNRALDFHRKNRRMVPMEPEMLDEQAAPAFTPSEDLEMTETARALRGMIGELSPKQRQAVWLKFIVGLSYQEISQIMETSIGNVGYLIHHGVARLRERWHEMEAVGRA